jgi:polysaccharide deacetylase 2 family uncharacterized protein YibQ
MKPNVKSEINNVYTSLIQSSESLIQFPLKSVKYQRNQYGKVYTRTENSAKDIEKRLRSLVN